MTRGAGQDQAISIPKMGSLEMPFHSSRVNLRDGNNGGFNEIEVSKDCWISGYGNYAEDLGSQNATMLDVNRSPNISYLESCLSGQSINSSNIT